MCLLQVFFTRRILFTILIYYTLIFIPKRSFLNTRTIDPDKKTGPGILQYYKTYFRILIVLLRLPLFMLWRSLCWGTHWISVIFGLITICNIYAIFTYFIIRLCSNIVNIISSSSEVLFQTILNLHHYAIILKTIIVYLQTSSKKIINSCIFLSILFISSTI